MLSHLKSMSLFALALLAFDMHATDAEAREDIRGRRVSQTQLPNTATTEVSDEAEEEEPENGTSAHALQLLVGGARYESKYRTSIPTMKQAHKAACYSAPVLHRRSICRSWSSASNSFEAAGKSLGLPAPALVCLMKAESNFVPGQTSPVGAAGLTQFMPRTARHFQSKMRAEPEYQRAWEAYRKNGGSTRRVASFTAANIRSGNPAMADVQIFATAMYFHDSMSGIESILRQNLGAPPEPNATNLKRLMHYWLIAYNAGETAGRKFLYRVRSDRRAYNYLPRETQKYIKKFDSCMAQAARY